MSGYNNGVFPRDCLLQVVAGFFFIIVVRKSVEAVALLLWDSRGQAQALNVQCVRACLFMHAHVHTYRGSSKCAVDAVFLLGWQEFKPPYF